MAERELAEEREGLLEQIEETPETPLAARKSTSPGTEKKSLSSRACRRARARGPLSHHPGQRIPRRPGPAQEVEQEVDPSWRMISEYEIGRYGWLMAAAFFCWGLGVLDLQMELAPSLQTHWGKTGRWWLVVIAVAMIAAGIFTTNAITDNTPSMNNTLHTLCGAIVIMTFPVAASLVARSLLRNPKWVPARDWLVWGTVVCWLGLLVFFGSIIVSQMIHPGAGRVAEPADGGGVQLVDDRRRAARDAIWMTRPSITTAIYTMGLSADNGSNAKPPEG